MTQTPRRTTMSVLPLRRQSRRHSLALPADAIGLETLIQPPLGRLTIGARP